MAPSNITITQRSSPSTQKRYRGLSQAEIYNALDVAFQLNGFMQVDSYPSLNVVAG